MVFSTKSKFYPLKEAALLVARLVKRRLRRRRGSRKTGGRILALVLFLATFPTHAEITEGGSGVLFGSDHAFAVTAKAGWVLDNQSGVGQGLHMLFYPKDQHWPNSPVIIYGRSIATSEAPDVGTLVANTISEFHADGSPDYSGARQAPLVLQNGQEAELYFYAGDQWGNYEAAIYFQEADTINYLVLTSRSKESFDKYYQDFREIAATYQNRYTPSAELTAEKRNRLEKESRALLQKPGGKDYEMKAVQAVGQDMVNAMRDCTTRIPEDEMPSFHYFVRIDRDGTIIESSIFPTSALSTCFSGIMSGAQYPAHGFDTFLLNIEMKYSP
jgi:hypothetical protein